jgi:1,4-dihydroxy-2-naphthoate octaprenyltransferase
MYNLKLKAWVHAARLRTLPLAISGIILATFIAYNQGLFHWCIFILALTTTLLLQILSNLANDYGDFTHGTDNENRVGPERAVQSGIISPNEMKLAIYIIGMLAFATGVVLLISALDKTIGLVFILFLITGLLAIGAAIKYTVGKSNYGYKGFGDIMVFLFFGIASVMGTHFLYTLKTDWKVLLPAAAIGLLSAGVLNVNNMRDFSNDKISCKITLAVRFQKKGSKIYHLALILLSLIFLSVYLFIINEKNILLSMVVPALPLLLHSYNVLRNDEPKKLDPELKKLALSTLFISFWIGIGLIL